MQTAETRESPLILLVAFVALLFLTGGGARADIQSLIVIRPVAVVLCALGLYWLTVEQWRDNRFLLLFAASVVAVVGLHLVPLPSAVWQALPGRGLIVEVDRAAGFGDIPRPLAMVPASAWNAFYALTIPLAVLLLGLQLSQDQHLRLLKAFFMLGLLSGIFGLLQVAGGGNSALYSYRITNDGSAVGLFANRNHQALLLAMLFPMLATIVSTRDDDEGKLRMVIIVAGLIGVALIPLILITGSRAGLAAGLFCLVAAVCLFKRPAPAEKSERRRSKPRVSRPAAIGIGVFGIATMIAITLLSSRAEAVRRLAQPDEAGELRLQIWPSIARMAADYFPFGSGAGSFVEVFQIQESHDMLRPSYLNHAHNDWLEVWLTMGFPGLVMLGLAVAAWALCTWKIWRSPAESAGHHLARLGSVLLLVLALGSISDYPVRVPTLAALLSICTVWTRINSGREPVKSLSI